MNLRARTRTSTHHSQNEEIFLKRNEKKKNNNNNPSKFLTNITIRLNFLLDHRQKYNHVCSTKEQNRHESNAIIETERP